jgi:hypothetical protein
MYEHQSEPILDRQQFLVRVLRHGGASVALLAASLAAGTVGYHVLAGLRWIDAFLNASMILSGMGPIGELDSPEGKLFAACFALYSGVVFVVTAGVLVTPFLHRLLHYLHLAR